MRKLLIWLPLVLFLGFFVAFAIKAPLVPFHCTSWPSAETPRSSSLGAEMPIVIPCVDASTLAAPARFTPPTVSTPGIVAGAPT